MSTDGMTGYTTGLTMSKGMNRPGGGSSRGPKEDLRQKYAGVNTTRLGASVQRNILDRLGGQKSQALAQATTGAYSALSKATRDIQAQSTQAVNKAGLSDQGAGVAAQQATNKGILDAIVTTH